MEIRYDHFTGGRFRHGARLLRLRPGKAPRRLLEARLGTAVESFRDLEDFTRRTGAPVDALESLATRVPLPVELTKVGRRWCRPHGATPTTHIFKLPLGLVGGSRRVDLSDSVENEWLCAEILRAMGLPVATIENLVGDAVSFSGRVDQMIALVRQPATFVGNDSGPNGDGH